MVSPRKRILADRPRPLRRQGSKLGAVKLTVQGPTSTGAGCSDQLNAKLQQAAPELQQHQQAVPRQQRQQQASQSQSRSSEQPPAAASSDGSSAFSDWADSGFGFDTPARSTAGRPLNSRAAKHVAKPHSPNLLANVQRGFKALLDGDAHVSERDSKAAAAGKSPSPEPSFLNKGLDAFNAVSRAAVGVATSLDSHIEQLMEQHGWADRAAAKNAVLSSRSGGGGDGSGYDGGTSFLDFQDFDAGASLFGGAAAAVIGGGNAGCGSSGGGNGAKLQRQVSGGSRRAGGSSRSGGRARDNGAVDRTEQQFEKPASPGVAEKAAASMAALLPSTFRPKETVSGFLSEVWGGGQLGSMLNLEPAPAQQPKHRRQCSSKGRATPQQAPSQPHSHHHELAEWGNDSGVFSSIGSDAGADSPAALSRAGSSAAGSAAAISIAAAGRGGQGKQEAEAEEVAASPTADKENQGAGSVNTSGAAGTRKQQVSGGVDWEDFLSGESQVLQPSTMSRASSMCGDAGGDSRAARPADAISSPLQPPTPQQQQDTAAPGGQDGEALLQAGAAEPRAVAERAAANGCCGSPVRPAAARRLVPPRSPGTDPISEQVRSQLEALVAEKSALAQENARLQRENCGLQELLSYTMQAAAGPDSQCGSDHDDALSDWSIMDNGCGAGATFPSVDNGVSPVKMRRRLSASDLGDDAGDIPNMSDLGNQIAEDRIPGMLEDVAGLDDQVADASAEEGASEEETS